MNLLPNIFDRYERNARLYPAVLVLLPVIVAVFCTIPSFPQTTTTCVIGGLILVAGAYALMFIVRQCGRTIEPSLWEGWKGPPSTRFMLWSDGTFSDEWKAVGHKTVLSALGIKLLTKKEEQSDAGRAARLIADSFVQVKSVLKLEKPEGDHQIHNIEYGFARNLLGSCFLSAGLATGAAAWCGFFWSRENDTWAAVGCALSVVLLIVCVAAKFSWLPAATKLAADRYAEKAWTTFIELKRDKAGGKKK